MASTLPTPADCCDDCCDSATLAITTPITRHATTVETIAALRALYSYEDMSGVFVLGSAAALDGLGGLYYFESSETAADDGVSIIKPDNVAVSAAGRWKKFL